MVALAAVVIGINYNIQPDTSQEEGKRAGLTRLRFAEADASLFRTFLESPRGGGLTPVFYRATYCRAPLQSYADGAGPPSDNP